MDEKPQVQSNDQPAETAKKHAVQTSIRYAMIGHEAVNTYVTLGGKRVYIRGVKEGEKVTAEQAKKLSK